MKAAASLNPSLDESGRPSIIEQVRFLVGNAERRMSGEDKDRINILIMGDTLLHESISWPSAHRWLEQKARKSGHEIER